MKTTPIPALSSPAPTKKRRRWRLQRRLWNWNAQKQLECATTMPLYVLLSSVTMKRRQKQKTRQKGRCECLSPPRRDHPVPFDSGFPSSSFVSLSPYGLVRERVLQWTRGHMPHSRANVWLSLPDAYARKFGSCSPPIRAAARQKRSCPKGLRASWSTPRAPELITPAFTRHVVLDTCQRLFPKEIWWWPPDRGRGVLVRCDRVIILVKDVMVPRPY